MTNRGYRASRCTRGLTITMAYEVYTIEQRPELIEQVRHLSSSAWPEFLRHGDVYHWGDLFRSFADYQIVLCNPLDTVVATGFAVPLIWNGSLDDLPPTIEDILLRALDANKNQLVPTTLASVAVIVAKSNQGQGLSSEVLREMKSLARKHKLDSVIIPVRPTWKSRYPLTAMERYAQWTRPDGAPLDPWLRVHWRLGADQLKIAPCTLTVSGTVAEWESWTQMQFPETGQYVVPGALQPVVIDSERDEGGYEDPNVWMWHPLQVEA